MKTTQLEPRRDLTLTHATSLVVGITIGTGVFLKSAAMAQAVGTPALVLGAWVIGPQVVRTSPIPNLDTMTNTAALGQVLYTRYIYYFQIAGVVLLIAMIGAIVLTLRHKPNVRRQNIADQVARTTATAIEIRQVRPGQGI